MSAPTERQRLLAEIRQLNRQVMEASAYRWQGPWIEMDLTIGQLKVLFNLSFRPPTHMTDLARHLGVTLPSCTTLVDRLARAGMVDRQVDPADRRRVLCVLSEQGRALLEKLRSASDLLSEEALSSLTEEEMETIAQAMRILLRTVSTPRTPASTSGDSPQDVRP